MDHLAKSIHRAALTLLQDRLPSQASRTGRAFRHPQIVIWVIWSTIFDADVLPMIVIIESTAANEDDTVSIAPDESCVLAKMEQSGPRSTPSRKEMFATQIFSRWTDQTHLHPARADFAQPPVQLAAG